MLYKWPCNQTKAFKFLEDLEIRVPLISGYGRAHDSRLAYFWAFRLLWPDNIWLKITPNGLYTGLPWSMPNANQCQWKFWHWSQFKFLSISINGRSSRIDLALMFYWCLDPACRGIDRNWSALIGNDHHWEAFRIDAMILICIWHWSREYCIHLFSYTLTVIAMITYTGTGRYHDIFIILQVKVYI